MNIRDRVGQSATHTSGGLVFDLTAGAAEAGHVTFATAFDFAAIAAGTTTWDDIPVLVERANGEWAVLKAALEYVDGTGVATLTGVLHTSSTGAALALDPAEEVVITLSPAAMAFAAIAVEALDPPSGAAEQQQGGHYPRVTAGGLLAIGKLSRAQASQAVAIGDNAGATGIHAFSFGQGMNVGTAYGVGFGVNAFVNMPLALGHGVGNVVFPGAMTQYLTRDRGVLNAKTTDATPTLLAVDVVGTGALVGSDEFYIDSGLSVLEGVLTAVASNGDMKAWKLRWVVRTELDWSATAMVDVPLTDELYASAGAASWAVAPVVDSVNNGMSVQVTGEAAKNIVWGLTYDMQYHTVYI